MTVLDTVMMAKRYRCLLGIKPRPLTSYPVTLMFVVRLLKYILLFKFISKYIADIKIRKNVKLLSSRVGVKICFRLQEYI